MPCHRSVVKQHRMMTLLKHLCWLMRALSVLCLWKGKHHRLLALITTEIPSQKVFFARGRRCKIHKMLCYFHVCFGFLLFRIVWILKTKDVVVVYIGYFLIHATKLFNFSTLFWTTTYWVKIWLFKSTLKIPLSID